MTEDPIPLEERSPATAGLLDVAIQEEEEEDDPPYEIAKFERIMEETPQDGRSTTLVSSSKSDVSKVSTVHPTSENIAGENQPTVCSNFTTAALNLDDSSSDINFSKLGNTDEDKTTPLVGDDGVRTKIVSREWQTEKIPASYHIATQRKTGADEVVTSMIPEKDAVLWQIKDFHAFRAASKVSGLPPLVSPEFGGGCYIRLELYHKKHGHIVGHVELPLVKAVRDGVAHIKISVIRPDMKVITTRKLDMKIVAPNLGAERQNITRSKAFQITFGGLFYCGGAQGVERLVVDDCLRLRIEFEYFPFDAEIFRGLERISTVARDNNSATNDASHASDANSLKPELLTDIRSYCQEDPSQYVEICNTDAAFQACRFLLCARSTKFREIFKLTQNRGVGTPGCPGKSLLSSITIQDIGIDCLSEMLTYIHSDTCHWLEDQAVSIFNVLELFEAADTYGIESLRKRLLRHLAARLDRDNFVYMFEVAERCHDPDFRTLCTNFMDSIPGSHVATIMRATSFRAETPRT